MAIIAQRRTLSFPFPLSSSLDALFCIIKRLNHTATSTGENLCFQNDCFDTSTWKVVDSRTVGVNKWMVASPVWTIMKVLQRKGYDSYLVGGCVRDLLLGKTPKDFDVVTTAGLNKIRRTFHDCLIVGRRFPVCHVNIQGSTVEVSSFETTDPFAQTESNLDSHVPSGCNHKDFIRWKDCMRRDFTINGLFYDPFANTIYDYANGMKDLSMCKLRTLKPAHASFREDCARILRGFRIAARLNLVFSKETASAIRDLSSSIAMLSKARLLLELNYMLAFGAAEASLQLLWKFRLLEIVLPLHAAYLTHQAKILSDGNPNMLMGLFANLDKLLASNRPSNTNLWIGLLAFHLALLSQPQEALVVWTFSSFLFHGNWSKAVSIGRQNAQVGVHYLPEILESKETKTDALLSSEVSQFALKVISSIDAMSEPDASLETVSDLPLSPCLGLALISKRMANQVAMIFEVVRSDRNPRAVQESSEIDYKLLRQGDLEQVRFVLGKVIMETLKAGAPLIEKMLPSPPRSLSAIFRSK
ncbi:uncharacterized protein LOC18424055 [Amborella trichopoda]|uniref:Poly A polymerase head domain-containing protein n=1 Tax=Amborella trichopoda TaxID=13333 RepID=W1NLM1_AMBTC|nr:uncharacterized protein LOC18424055 [Amborella trichopoda]ERM96135.1 hypothetical protein AMTR_s00001p00028400 [Amborella trichopoda]|eukprot:XP_011628844.2 uncharacterized protein LOC18424055 [Amborella trichopoda]